MRENTLEEVRAKRTTAELRFQEALKKSAFPTEEAYREAKMEEADTGLIKRRNCDVSNSNIIHCVKQLRNYEKC